ncbi:GMC oxidoreductase-domain-containing protein [Cyathus striatus]|nr:GMC oxidoreductase-domain-containing protein [Cyathus striatus]
MLAEWGLAGDVSDDVTLIGLFLFSVAHVGHGAIHQNFNQLETGPPYDFIVAGGGTAGPGPVIASRLTENPNFRVLVLEAGPSNEGIVDIDAPGLWTNLAKSSFDWNFTTVPQAALNGCSLEYTRGHVLGGSSSINGMFYTRGSSDDYNRWATITGDRGWSWNNIFHFILKNEHFISSAGSHSTAGQFDPAFHSFTGNAFVSLPGFSEPLDKTYLETTNLNGEFPGDTVHLIYQAPVITVQS